MALAQPASVNDDRRRVERIAAARSPDAVDRVRLRGADQGAAALRLRDAERAPVAAAALARGGADRARDHGRRRADGRLDHAPHRRARQRAGVPASAASRSPPDDTYGSLAARLQRARRRAARAAAAATSARRRSSSRTRRASPTPRRSDPRTACSTAPPGRGAGARGARAAPAHRRASGARRGRQPARGARARALAPVTGHPPEVPVATDGRSCCSDAADGALELLCVQPAAGAPAAMRCAAAYLRGHGRPVRSMASARPATACAASPRRASALTRCCAGCSSAAPTPIARCAREARGARRPRPGAGDAPGLRRRAAPRHARLLIERARRAARRAAGRAGAGRAAPGAVRAAVSRRRARPRGRRRRRGAGQERRPRRARAGQRRAAPRRRARGRRC